MQAPIAERRVATRNRGCRHAGRIGRDTGDAMASEQRIGAIFEPAHMARLARHWSVMACPQQREERSCPRWRERGAGRQLHEYATELRSEPPGFVEERLEVL